MCRRNSRSTAFFGSSRKVSEPGPAARGLRFSSSLKYSGRNCDGLKVLSWTEGVQEQLSTNCAAYAHSAAPGHSVSAAAQAGPGGRAHPAGPGRPRRDPLARLPRRA